MKVVDIYADGACAGNPGPGGWGTVIAYPTGQIATLSGGESFTTNNRMELLGVINGIAAIEQPSKIRVFSDSKYVVDSIQLGWAKTWRANGWRKYDGKPAKNIDLFIQLLDLCAKHSITFIWVKGHAGNTLNEVCDSLAKAEIHKYTRYS